MMLAHNVQRILAGLPENAVVLDVGGGVQAFERANYVIDILPFDERRSSSRGTGRHWTQETWIVHDICAGRWPFQDKQFDFVVCSQVLEDVRDPLTVCAEMIRVGKAGYIETPSRLCESTRGVARRYLAGFAHHRWFVDVGEGTIAFTMKNHKIHSRRYSFGLAPNRRLRQEHAAVCLFWQDAFAYCEHYPQDWNDYLRKFRRTERLRGKTEWKHSPATLLRKVWRQLTRRPEALPGNILDRSG